jgi:3-hydroxy-9,10-secoandrosta-1,3,5(10)-triene-9,17-dione monooxygenase reductase component
MVIQRDDAPPGVELTDPAAFRRVLGHFCTGVVIVTAIDGGAPVGMTCQSFSSLSLDPPLVLFSASHSSTSWPRIRRVGSFAVNILADHQEATSRAFAVSGGDKFAAVDWSPGVMGAPLLSGCVAHVECRLQSIVAGGDHDIVIGEPVAMGEDPSQVPLLFFRSGYGRFAPEPSHAIPTRESL